jgi:hypothetical protein
MMDASRYRSRSSLQTFGGREWSAYDPSLLDRKHSSTVAERQETHDSKHNWPNDLGPIWDTGGPFTSEKMSLAASPMKVSLDVPHWIDYRYNGDILPFAPGDYEFTVPSHWKDGNLSPDGELNLVALGAQAASRSAPTNPHAALSTTIGELAREGLPAITGLTTLKGRGKPTAVAGEYLNHEFGVRPLVSDVKALCNAVKKSKDILEQYYRDSGKVVRRKYAFPSEVETSSFRYRSGVTSWPILQYPFYSQPYGNIDVVRTTTKRTWFSGAFTYYAKSPTDASDLLSYYQQANHLLGVGVTPATIWNLTPWSWALDWFGNIGDVLNNVSMAMTDGLVMRYGYLMQEYRNETTYRFSGATLYDGRPIDCSVTYNYTLKRRRGASPFGFGITDSDLTPKQWSILAALGMTLGGPRATRTR